MGSSESSCPENNPIPGQRSPMINPSSSSNSEDTSSNHTASKFGKGDLVKFHLKADGKDCASHWGICKDGSSILTYSRSRGKWAEYQMSPDEIESSKVFKNKVGSLKIEELEQSIIKTVKEKVENPGDACKCEEYVSKLTGK